MIFTITLDERALGHLQPNQYGAFLAHCMKLANFWSMQVFSQSRKCEISFKIGSRAQVFDGQKIEQQLANDLEALSKLDPMPCPCGCGAFIAISPCLEQAGEMTKKGLTEEEVIWIGAGEHIQAIKAIRIRTGFGLRDAKDMADRYRDSLPKEHPASRSPF